MDEIVAQLRRLGMSAYEAKAYTVLVEAGRPLNGYEVAKLSGVPRSTVYETLNKLVSRPAAFETHTDAGVAYIALPPATLLGRIRNEAHDALDHLGPLMTGIESPRPVPFAHQISTEAEATERAIDVIAGARSGIKALLWSQDYASVLPAFRRAHAARVAVSLTLLGASPNGAISAPDWHVDQAALARRNGTRLLVVVGDDRSAVIASLTARRVHGRFTDDPALIVLAETLLASASAQSIIDGSELVGRVA